MEELKARGAEVPESVATNEGPARSYGEVSHKSLSEQVAFLREREVFIGESENTLVDKARQLQERETRLQQDYRVGLAGAVAISPALDFSLLYRSSYNALADLIGLSREVVKKWGGRLFLRLVIDLDE